MTDMYTHQGLLARPVTSPEAMKLQWSHSVLLERDYLSEWRAQECASMLAADMGSSAWLRVDTISLPMRRRCKSGHVRFCDNVTVLIGEDDGLDFRPTMIHHSALSDFQDKPWRLRSHSSKLRSEHQDSAVTSFMARRPSQPARSSPSAISSASSSSTSTSSSSSQARSTEWRQTVLILLDGRILPARLPWNDGEQLIIHVQQAIGDQGQGLYGLHHVSHRPEDLLQQGLECLLVQTGLEPRPSTFLRLILVDLEIFEPNEVLPGAFKRFAKWIPESVNRVSVFRLLGLESLLRAHPERSHLWHNNIIVPENQISPIYPRDGDYLHILIGDSVDGFPCLPSSPTSFSEDNTEENDTISGLQTSSWTTSFQAPTTESTDVDPLSNVASCISSIDFCKQQPYMQSTNEPFSYFSSREDDGPTDHNLDYFGRPPRVEQPIWQHEVWDLLRAHGEVEMEEEGPIIYVTSHYISHTRVPRNTVTRPLRFDTDHETWEASVRFMWEDFTDDQMPLDIFLVIPAPPTTVYQGTVATVLITQHPLPDRAACVLSTSMVGHTHLRNVQTAYSAAIPCMVDDLIAVADEPALCAPADAGLPPCQIWNGPQELPHGHEVHVHDGLGLQVLIPEARAHDTVISPEVGTEVGTDPTHINDEEDVEDTALLTTKPAAVTCGLDLPSGVEETNFYQQTSVRLEQPVLQWNPDVPDPFLEDLAGLWELLAFSWEDEPRSGIVLVWFIDHQWPEPYCLAPRAVHLYPAIQDWRRRMWQAWEDQIIPGAALDFHLVIPKPPTVESRIIAHVLLVQRQQPNWASVIVSVFDARAPTPEVSQMALTFPDRIQLDDLLQVIGVHRECTMTPPTLRCTAWHRDVTLLRGVPFPGRSGLSFLMQITDPPAVIPAPMEIDDNDDVVALQMPPKPSQCTLNLEKLIPENPKVVVDFTAAAEAYFDLMNVHLDFLHDWPTTIDFPEETIDALASLRPYEDGAPIRALHFYVDGSKVAGHEVGAATICLLETQDELALAGILPVHVQFAEHAYVGEHAAMVYALIWAVQFSTWHLHMFPGQPIRFHFNFDAMNTGCQAAGWWRAHEYREWQTLFRSLAHILEHRHGARQIVWTHVRAHAHHPWNEMADRVAKYASMHPHLVGTCDQWYHWLSDSTLLNAFQWIWYLEVMRSGSHTAAPLRGLLLEHSVISPHIADLPEHEAICQHHESREVRIDIKFATANILTLSTNIGHQMHINTSATDF